jgi:hypothetical protein
MRAAGIMRRSFLESLVYARGREAFGGTLVDLPLLRAGLLEMLLDAEAAASVVLHAAALLDRADAGSAPARRLVRVLTPLAKYWITHRARTVAGEAMNVRGGNGYVEDWVNPRLLRDSYLGAIWEGASNVVALDVQRAILKDEGMIALGGFIRERLDGVTEAGAAPAAELTRNVLATLETQTGAWATLPKAERELAARPVADLLYHLLAVALLLGEGPARRAQCGDFRKYLVGTLYADRWLRPPAPGAPVFPPDAVGWLEALADWQPIPASALGALAGAALSAAGRPARRRPGGARA